MNGIYIIIFRLINTKKYIFYIKKFVDMYNIVVVV